MFSVFKLSININNNNSNDDGLKFKLIKRIKFKTKILLLNLKIIKKMFFSSKEVNNREVIFLSISRYNELEKEYRKKYIKEIINRSEDDYICILGDSVIDLYGIL